ncbi:MAG: UDP-N-acetylglucosamine 2-epimerase (hydrolyzing) [Phycisphaerales bacterium]|jgi:UDP-hydrolysing UDP-N-acetyl-D-glucosamine 2-epimerase|nr:UDP-N-acetylglucosamine 2-epimerase (hydrolyzing) [Phycisphaerales bacterium]
MRGKRSVAVVTGSRADFGLLRPVMRAIAAREELELLVFAAGSHLVPPATTLRDVKAEFHVAELIPMQTPGRVGRLADAESVGKGVSLTARAIERHRPSWIVVLGDRIEAFAAASAAAVAGMGLAHIHGGDRAEGVADESMRHAITKLAHLHFAASRESHDRILRLGEPDERVHLVGSPAIDELASMETMSEATWRDLGSPRTLALLHPAGLSDARERAIAAAVFDAAIGASPALALVPNLDPGRDSIMGELREREARGQVRVLEHVPRAAFIGLLKKLASIGGVLIGNSSAGRIEAAAVGLRVIDVGPRQAGREQPPNVTHVGESELARLGALVRERPVSVPTSHPFGDGHAGTRIAEVLARIDPTQEGFTRKRNTY